MLVVLKCMQILFKFVIINSDNDKVLLCETYNRVQPILVFTTVSHYSLRGSVISSILNFQEKN